MADELRVPVTRLDARLMTGEGTSHEVTVFLPPGLGIEHLFQASEPFFPASEEGRIRIFARASLAAVAAQPGPSAAHDELLTENRAVVVRLRGGAVIEGMLRHAPSMGRIRTADLLNEPTATFCLEGDGVVYQIAKAYVACVDEVLT